MMSHPLRYLCVCSGISAPTVAWQPLGWEPVAFAEIEPFPCAVLAHHYPRTPNLGDITKYADWNFSGPINLLAGGTPCQAFSVAGKRGGLEDARGNLALTFCEIADRHGPDWILWENVPGVLSDKGNAFGCFLGRLCGADHSIAPDGGKWTSAGVVSGPSRTVAWRVLDAQYFGLAQRRRRVFVLAVPGARNWRCAAALFPVGDGLRWHPPARGEAREGVAPTISARTKGGGGLGPAFDCDGGLVTSHDPACTLTAREYKGPLPEADLSTVVCGPLTASPFADNASQETKLVPTAFRHFTGPADTGAPQVDMAPTLRGSDTSGLAIAFDTTQITSPGNVSSPRPGEPCHPLAAGAHPPAVAFQECQSGVREYASAGAQRARGPGHDPVGTRLRSAAGVRRLLPVECARLQGFPDDYLDIIFRGRPAADGNKYKALGNSMAVPVIRWIGQRIEFVRRNYA